MSIRPAEAVIEVWSDEAGNFTCNVGSHYVYSTKALPAKAFPATIFSMRIVVLTK
jgi:hypothetical protein